MQRFFQLNLSVAELFKESSLKCCLDVAYYIEAFASMPTSWPIYVLFM